LNTQQPLTSDRLQPMIRPQPSSRSTGSLMQRPVSWSLHAETAVEGAKDRERAQQRRELLNLGAGAPPPRRRATA